ncbi:MAG: S-layer homology domain-containing protein, partial [Faecalibacterium prausnitzii]|nr:S-layer homology domain-containing protein [Faecalibacterium prausnitzii]
AVAEVSSQNAIVNISGGQFAGTKAAIIKSSTSNATIAISGGKFSSDPSVYVVGNGNTNIVKRDGSEGAYTYTVLAKSDLTSGVYLTDPSGALASNYYVSSTANGVWTVSYSAPSSGGGSSSSSRRYDVSAPSVKHGDVTVSPKNASKGDTVTITVKPDSGYELDTLTVKDASGSKIKVKDKGNGKYTFTMPASKVEVNATFVKEVETSPFSDVSTSAYYYEAVKWAQEKGITGGIGNGLFEPNQPCTRAQIVTFLWRAAGSPEPKSMSSFSDVSADSYYAKAVAWAVENGITTGTGDGKFSPDATCTRAQSVTFLFRAIGKLVDSKAEFSDVLTDSYYANAVAWAVENGVTNGIGDGLFGPDNSCTRAQIVTFLYRAYQGK